MVLLHCPGNLPVGQEFQLPQIQRTLHGQGDLGDQEAQVVQAIQAGPVEYTTLILYFVKIVTPLASAICNERSIIASLLLNEFYCRT